jgi:hypothetical protein
MQMPVTARLSKLFYDRLGESITNELVDWFNQVDTTYRFELREISESNYARFEARLEQRLAELKAELLVEIRSLDAKFDAKFEMMESRFQAKLDAAMRDQMRFFFLAWAGLLVALGVPIMGLWFR